MKAVKNAIKRAVPSAWRDTVALPYHRTNAHIAGMRYGNPAKLLQAVGVTGTNGKTTVTHLVEQILVSAGNDDKVGVIGTLGYRMGKSSAKQTGNTTPMAMELQRILAEMVADGKKYCVMEVSSLALVQQRTRGVDFAVTILTNITQDHLDYHKTMDRYWKAKARLFSGMKSGVAVINRDSDYAGDIIARVPKNVTVVTYGLSSDSMVRAKDISYTPEGTVCTVVTPDGMKKMTLQLGGEFNVYNALAALAAGRALGVSLDTCIRALQQVTGVPGRFEVVSRRPVAIVDYAHTPDGLENVLRAARKLTPQGARLFVVFGCGGDRDAGKRSKMGRIAERHADEVIITSDNPRTEDPDAIIQAIKKGLEDPDAQTVHVESDRKVAITTALQRADPEDVVLIAGKGHEDYQIIGTKKTHFDDREIVRSLTA